MSDTPESSHVEPAPEPIDKGDHAWMLVSSALVLMMTGPGLLLFYCGLVPQKERAERDDAVRVSDGADDRSSGPSGVIRWRSAACPRSPTFSRWIGNGDYLFHAQRGSR